MNLDFNKVFPTDPSIFEGFQFVRIIAALLLFVVVVRSCIHLFASDGGAQRIAGIDTSVEGGKNIIAMFHQLFLVMHVRRMDLRSRLSITFLLTTEICS
jgi:hypothetical protein